MISEKRKHIRVNSLNLSHVAVDNREDNVKQAIGRTLNVSETGILLETHFPIESDQDVELTMGFEEDLVNLRGKVIHLLNGETGKFEMGIQFTDIDDKAVDIIKEFIQKFRELKK